MYGISIVDLCFTPQPIWSGRPEINRQQVCPIKSSQVFLELTIIFKLPINRSHIIFKYSFYFELLRRFFHGTWVILIKALYQHRNNYKNRNQWTGENQFSRCKPTWHATASILIACLKGCKLLCIQIYSQVT